MFQPNMYISMPNKFLFTVFGLSFFDLFELIYIFSIIEMKSRTCMLKILSVVSSLLLHFQSHLD